MNFQKILYGPWRKSYQENESCTRRERHFADAKSKALKIRNPLCKRVVLFGKTNTGYYGLYEPCVSRALWPGSVKK